MRKKSDERYKKPVVISGDKVRMMRLREGKKKQAQGNAIERLGKNLTGVKAMFNHSRITPFIRFWLGV